MNRIFCFNCFEWKYTSIFAKPTWILNIFSIFFAVSIAFIIASFAFVVFAFWCSVKAVYLPLLVYFWYLSIIAWWWLPYVSIPVSMICTLLWLNNYNNKAILRATIKFSILRFAVGFNQCWSTIVVAILLDILSSPLYQHQIDRNQTSTIDTKSPNIDSMLPKSLVSLTWHFSFSFKHFRLLSWPDYTMYNSDQSDQTK